MKYFNDIKFPEPSGGFIRATRIPVLFRPIIGSSEQFVIGAIACSESSSYLAKANKLEKLNCLYGEQATGAIFAIELALDEIAIDLSEKRLIRSSTYVPPVSGVQIGLEKEVEGVSLKEIASSWLAGMSSLFVDDTKSNEVAPFSAVDIDDGQPTDRAVDRLSQLLLEYISERKPKLKNAFSYEIRSHSRRRRGNAHGVFIDFAGAKIVANFGTLSNINYSSSIDRIKRRMWDLKVARDEEKSGFLSREHEMIVQHPSENDPNITQRQVDKVMESIRDLEKQADQEEIRFRPMLTVEQIGNQLMKVEAA